MEDTNPDYLVAINTLSKKIPTEFEIINLLRCQGLQLRARKDLKVYEIGSIACKLQ